MIVTSLVQTGLAGLLTFLFVVGHPSAPTITLIALGNGVCAALGFPSFQAMLPDLVPVEDLPGAIALSSAQYNLGRVIGPAIAGHRDRRSADANGTCLAEGVNAVELPRRRRRDADAHVAPAVRAWRATREVLPLDRRRLPLRATTSRGCASPRSPCA